MVIYWYKFVICATYANTLIISLFHLKRGLTALSILTMISELIFPTPRICPLCQSKQDKLMVCENCLRKLAKLKKAMGQCQRCGSFGIPAKVCNNCRTWPKYFKSNCAAVPYEKEYREILHLVKFRKQGWLVPVLADLMAELVPTATHDLIIPVPLHENRLRERGFNQSTLIAKKLALRVGIQYDDRMLIRILDTPHQTGLDLYQRQNNLVDAFKVNKETDIKGKSILLVDDTLTTGTTLLECAKTLHQNGAKYIYGLTFAAGIK